jgi:FlgD Ig-like domain
MNPIKQAGLLMLEGLAIAMAALSFTPSAHANVYATNIKLNGGMSNISTSQGSNVNISYVLNENATAGVTIKILSGATAVRTITIPAGSAGTLKGLNNVVWNGKNDSNSNVPVGTYSASITAGATGFSDWTQTSDDSNTNLYVYRSMAMGVVKDTNSPYYGRVFVGNAKVGTNAATVLGDQIGILKYNADGSYADEGGFGTGGYPMLDDGFNDCPLKIKIGDDGRLYFNDWASGRGTIVATDLELTTNQIVLDLPNYVNNPYPRCNWQCFDVSGTAGTNGRIWLGDGHFPGPAGVYVWNMTNGIADPNDTSGTQAVIAGGDLSLLANAGIWVDNNTNIFISQARNNPGDVAVRALMFTNYDGVTPFYSSATGPGAGWMVGSADNTFRGGWDMDGDNRANPHYLAFAVALGTGGIRILNAADGSTVVTNLSAGNFYWSISWDNVGNVYAAAQSPQSIWRAFSPPGANQATTMALPSIQVTAAIARPAITSISVAGGTVTINFTGDAGDSATAFTLQGSGNVSGTYADIGSAAISKISAGVFKATVTTAGSSQFYRIKR